MSVEHLGRRVDPNSGVEYEAYRSAEGVFFQNDAGAWFVLQYDDVTDAQVMTAHLPSPEVAEFAAGRDALDLFTDPPPPPPPPDDGMPAWAASAEDNAMEFEHGGDFNPLDTVAQTREGRRGLAQFGLRLLIAGAILAALAVFAAVLAGELEDRRNEEAAGTTQVPTTSVTAGSGPVATTTGSGAGPMLSATVSCADIIELVPELGTMTVRGNRPVNGSLPDIPFATVSPTSECGYTTTHVAWVPPDRQLCVELAVCPVDIDTWVSVSAIPAPGSASATLAAVRSSMISGAPACVDGTWAWPCVRSVDTPVDSSTEFAMDVLREVRGWDHPPQDNVLPENQPYGWDAEFSADVLWSAVAIVRDDTVYVIQAGGVMGAVRTWGDSGLLYPTVPSHGGAVEDFNPLIFGLPPQSELVLAVRNALDFLVG